MKHLFLLLLMTAHLGYSQQTITASITHDGLQRSYILYVPANYTGTQDVPLLFNFHGYTSNANDQMWYGDFRPIADTAGFLIVHPQGTLDGTGTTHFNAGFAGSTADDLGFTAALIDSLLLDYAIDEERVYSTGMSNGGYMSLYIACNLSDRFAGVASVTGSMTPAVMTSCNPTHPTPIMQIHGTADGTVNYNGTAFASESIQSVLNYWSGYNNTDATAITTNVPNTSTTDGCTAEKIEYLNGDNCTEVVHYKVIDGGHTWPGAIITIGVTNQDFKASTEIWKFLSRYDINGLRATCTLLQEENKVEEFQIYPNPSTAIVTVQGSFVTEQYYEVVNAVGQQVKTGTIDNLSKEIDLSSLKPDVYFLKLNDQTIRIVKTK